MSAKGHFNPHGKPHGAPSSAERHAGDLPALKAGKDGRAKLDVTVDLITVRPGPAIVGGGSSSTPTRTTTRRSRPATPARASPAE